MTKGSVLKRVIGIVVLWSMPIAAAQFTAQTNFPCQGIVTKTEVDKTVSQDTGFVVCTTPSGDFVGQGGAAAVASAGGIGVQVEMFSGPLGQIGQATGIIDTTFTVLGPGVDPIAVSINFELSGFLGGGTGAGQVSFREIYNQVIIETPLPNGGGSLVYSYFGSALETFNFALNPGLSVNLSGQLAPAGEFCLKPDSTEPCRIESPVFQVYAGQQNSIRLLARANVSSTVGGSGNGIASFLNTFKFDPNQDVFNLPDGYTVEVEGMNVVNNRVVDPNGNGEVPEPATYVLTGGALVAAMLWRGRRA